MKTQLQIDEIELDITHKAIKNIHLSVHPPVGKVTISAPYHVNIEIIRNFVFTKLGWIRREQKKIIQQERETDREFINQESHYIWGKRFLMKVIKTEDKPFLQIKHNKVIFYVDPKWGREEKKEFLENWYRDLTREKAEKLVESWKVKINVNVSKIFVQHMKTKWGSCNPKSLSIRLNSDLAKKPRECLEYIIVHELIHLIEPTHNPRFFLLINELMPKWRDYQQLLNSYPLSYESWKY
jgi:hypothetical protein